jgi:hypothetical protein
MVRHVPDIGDLSNPRHTVDHDHDWDRYKLWRAVEATFLYTDFR